MEYSAEMRMNGLQLLETTWMDLRYITLGKQRQIQKIYGSIDVQFKNRKNLHMILKIRIVTTPRREMNKWVQIGVFWDAGNVTFLHSGVG